MVSHDMHSFPASQELRTYTVKTFDEIVYYFIFFLF